MQQCHEPAVWFLLDTDQTDNSSQQLPFMLCWTECLFCGHPALMHTACPRLTITSGPIRCQLKTFPTVAHERTIGVETTMSTGCFLALIHICWGQLHLRYIIITVSKHGSLMKSFLNYFGITARLSFFFCNHKDGIIQ